MKHKRYPPCRSPRFNGLVEELELRLLFNADAAALISDPGALDAGSPSTPQIQVMPPTDNSASDAQETQATTQVTAPAQPVAKRVEIVFVDAHVTDAQKMVDELLAQADEHRTLEVHWLDATADGLGQISQVLQGRQDISAIHLISHGKDGELLLGSTLLNSETLSAHAGQLAGWGQSLTADADILIYGCDVAATPKGQHFLDDIGLLTGADIAASSDATGTASMGGDWTLEFNTGDVEAQGALQAAGQARWVGLLALNTYGSESLVNTTTTGSQTTTNAGQVAMSSSGTYVSIWSDAGVIKGKLFNSAGTMVLDEFTVATGTSAQVAMNNSGAFAVTWIAADGDVAMRTYNSSGVAQSGVVTVAEFATNGAPSGTGRSETGYTSPSIAMNDAGEAVVVYSQLTYQEFSGFYVEYTHSINFKAYNTAGTQLGSAVTVYTVDSSTYGRKSAGFSSIGMDAASGKFTVAWTQSSTATPDASVWAKSYTAARGTSGSAVQLNTTGTVTAPQVAIQSTGAGVVTWTQSNDIYFRLINGTGGTSGSATMANGSATNNQTASDVAVSPLNDSFTITWQDSSGSNDIYVKEYASNGTANGAETRVNTTTTGSQTTPSVARNGNFTVVTWSNPSTTSDVYMQRYAGVNSAPVNTVPSAVQVTNEDTAIVFSSGNGNLISIADADAGNIAVQVTLTVSNGTLTLSTTSGLTFITGDGSGDTTMVIRGSVASINAALAGMSYTPTANVYGTDTLTIVTNDLGNSGSGGALSDTDNIAIRVKPVNDNSVNTVPGAQNVSEDGTLIFSSGNGNLISISDSDATSMQVTLTATNGTLTLSQLTGLTFTVGDGTGDATMTFSGTVAAINAALAGMGFTPTANYNGGATVTIASQDRTLTALNVDADIKARYAFENTGNLGLDTGQGTHNATNTGVTSTNDATRGLVGNFDGSDNLEFNGLMGQPSNVTVAAWVKVTTADLYGASVITIGDSLNLIIDEASIGDKLAGYFWDGSAWHVTKFDITLAGTGWHHVAYSVDSTNNTQTLYLDGVAVSTTSFTEDVNYNRNTITRIGKFARDGWDGTGLNGNHNLNGQLDEMRVYKRALSAAEIASLATDLPAANTDTDVVNVTVTAVNDAPTHTGSNNFNTITEDQTTNGGQLVSSLFTSSEVDSGASSGIAVYGLSSGNGTWQYSTNGGGAWTNVGTVSGSSALLLRSTDYLRFVPNGQNADSGSVSYYAWDQTSGSAGSKVDVGTRGGTTAFSSTGGTSSITVTAVNDAPTYVGANNFTTITEDQTTNAGQLVSSLFSSSDVDSGALNGIALYTQTPSNGTWQYSTNGGSSWTDVGAVSSATALLLRSTDYVRFVPNAQNADTASIGFYIWDQSTGSAGSKVDVGTRGGTTAYSSSGGTSSITVTAVNDAPVITSNGGGATASVNVAENSTAVTTVTSTDVDTGATKTYSISGGADMAKFTINASTGVLTFLSAPNFESPTDVGGDNVYDVIVQVSDGTATDTQAIAVTVTNVNEAPVITSNGGGASASISIAENGTAVTTVTSTDVDAGATKTYTITGGADSTKFTIDNSTGVLTFVGAPNYESPTDVGGNNVYDVIVQVSDGALTDTQSIAVTVTDADEFDVGAVTDANGAANSVAENAANGSTVGITATASDADGTTNTITYSLSDNAGGRFTINASTGVVTVANGTLLNYETATSHNITVLATSADGSTSSQTFTINLTDVDEFNVGAVTDSNVAANTVAENAANGSTAGITASASDADGTTNTITYSLSDNAGGRFTINASTGVVTVANGTLLNYETATSHNITVLATSADGSTNSQTFTINLSDVDEFDVGVVTDANAAANSVAENAANGTTVGITATASDADGTTNTISYSLSDNAGGRFTINATTGVVTVANGTLLNYETATSHSITVLATSADGSTRTQTFTINLTDVDEFNVGVVSDSNAAANTVAENAANGSTVGVTASASDADATNNTITYSLSDNAGGRFTINASTGVVTVANGTLLNYETATSHNITVLATSSDGSSNSQSFTINLSDVDEFDVGAVTDTNGAANAISESASDGDTVGITASATDQDGSNNTITYTLSDDASGRFTINATTGVVTVADSSQLDFETDTSHNITVLATGSDGSTSSQTFTIQVINEADSGVGQISDADGSANTVAENAANGTAVGITALATDPDVSDTVTYTLSNNAGGRFAIDATTGVVTVANGTLLDREAASSHNITVLATSLDGSTNSRTFTITLSDQDESDVGAVTDTDGSANTVEENAANGTLVGITASASDADSTNSTITYSLSDNAGGRFTINASTGVVTVANGTLLDREAASSHNITVLATSADGSTSSQIFTISLSDFNESDVSAISDANGAADSVAENATNGTVVGVTASAVDADATNNTVTYTLSDNAGGRFAINASTGVVTVANGSLLDREAASSHTITVVATSVDGSTSSETFTINLIDVDEFAVGAVTDVDGAADTVAENAANGTVVGVTASASDADATTNTISYSLSDSAGGRFAINASTGVVTVANGTLLDREAASSHTITVVATSADGSTSTETFTINLSDVDEFDVGAVSDANATANGVAENASAGTLVGVTASASDADATNNTITYSLSDNAGGRFTIDATTGVVTVANGSLLDREAASSHTITVVATGSNGSTSTETFTINLSDVDEFNVGATSDADAGANTVSENAANGTAVGITATATDADATTNTITYTLSDSAGGRFTINASTGVVTVANGTLLDLETASSHNITVVATSADGSTSSQTFTINLSDVDEFDVGAVSDADATANSVAENAANGTAVGVIASAGDADATTNTITYTLSDNAGGRFAIDATTGVVTVANGTLLDREAASSHTITVVATSADGSTSSQTFTINLSDVDEFDVGAVGDTDASANGVAENAANGTVVGITASASDADATTNTVTYTLSDSAGGRFTINASTGVVTVANGSLLDREAASSHNITVVATSADGSTSSQTFTINLSDVDEFDVGTVSDTDASANGVAENAANGTVVGITASASDADATNNTVTYSLSDSAGGRFTINASTGVVTVANGSLLDREAASSHTITVLATSSDGSTHADTFTINLSDVDEFDVGVVGDADATANSVAENAANGTAVGITAGATDADATTNTITYSLSDNAGGRFTINASTGVVTVANGSLLDREAASSHTITVLATSADGSTSSQTFTINLSDVDEFDVGAVSDADASANSVAENAANGTAVGITASASDADATTNTVTYTLSDSAGGRFTINASTGVVTVADGSLLDREAFASHTITVLATGADGSTSSQTFTINLSDVDEVDVGPIGDTDLTPDTVAENAANGTAVGITARATDADATTNTVTYTLSDSAGGRFAIDASTGVVTVANGTLLDREAASSHTITVVATSADGSTSIETFTINLSDVNEFNVGAIGDTDAGANTVIENAANGTAVGITASASDADATTNTVTYTLSDSAGGRFAIDAATGIVTVANGTLLDREAAGSHTITVLATSADGSTSSQIFTINLGDADEFDVGAINDGNPAANTVAENATNGTAVGITASASDADATNNTVTYALSDNAGGRFAINASTGVITVADGSLLDREAASSHTITVVATSADGSTVSQTFTINVSDVDEFDIGLVSDTDGTANSVAENAANGSTVGITASASDADATDGVSYTLSDDAGGRFTINASTGVVTVADGTLLDRESAASYNITVLATSADGSSSSQTFTIALTDVDESDVGPVTDADGSANSVAENAANGSTVGITAAASDADSTTNTVTYTLSDSAGGRFTINASTGVVTVANGSLLDREAFASHTITVLATSADGSTSTQTFTINLSDVDEFDVGAISDIDGAANTVAENAANGTAVGIRASASDADSGTNTISYSLSDDAGGRFAIDAVTGVVTVANGSLLDREAFASHDIVLRATSADGSTSTQSFTIALGDVNESAPVIDTSASPVSVPERSTAVATMVVTDADATSTLPLSFSIVGGGDAARFVIDSSTGRLSFASAPNYAMPGDANGDNRYEVIIQVSDGTFQSTATFYADVQDLPEPMMPTAPQPPATSTPDKPAEEDKTPAQPPKDTKPPASEEGSSSAPSELPASQPGAGQDGGANGGAGGSGDLLDPFLLSPTGAGNAATRGGPGGVFGNVLYRFQLGGSATLGMDMGWVQPEISLNNTGALNEAQLALSRIGIPDSGLSSPVEGLRFVDTSDSDGGLLSVNLPQAVEVSGLAMSIGTIWWATRAGGLIASMVVSAPVWRGIDPLPVLFNREDMEGEGGENGESREDALAEQMFDARANKPFETSPIG